MINRRFWLLAVCCLMAAAITPAAQRTMTVDEVKPGMVGVARTVFAGQQIEEFHVHILGVLRNTIAPGRHLILARLEGGPLAKTGVIAGMSGSPVYIDGRLVGAVSYSLGSFATEPIAGITPIADMQEAARATAPARVGTPVTVPRVITPDTFLSLARYGASPDTPTGHRLEIGQSERLALQPGAALHPIATPLTISGISTAALQPLIDVLSGWGAVAAPAVPGVGGSAQAASAPLEPGSPVGVTLASGDMNIGATGTVTDVDNGTVLAFGHPFYGMGPTRLPMTSAWVHTILPSLSTSTKIASPGAVIGTFTQDRAPVLGGRLGPGPATIPVRITAVSAEGESHRIQFSMTDDVYFAPLIAYVGIGSVLSAFERDLGANTYEVSVRLVVTGFPAIEFRDVFSGDNAGMAVASSVAAPLSAMMLNDRERATIEGVEVEVRTAETIQSTSIERVWLGTTRLTRGSSVPVNIALRTYRGTTAIQTVTVPIPLESAGSLQLVVADAGRIASLEQRDGRRIQPQSLPQVISQIRQTYRNDRVYVRLYARTPGAVVAGEPLPALPGSVLDVVAGDAESGGTTPIGSTVLGAWELPTRTPVTGIRTLPIVPTPVGRQP